MPRRGASAMPQKQHRPRRVNDLQFEKRYCNMRFFCLEKNRLILGKGEVGGSTPLLGSIFLRATL